MKAPFWILKWRIQSPARFDYLEFESFFQTDHSAHWTEEALKTNKQVVKIWVYEYTLEGVRVLRNSWEKLK